MIQDVAKQFEDLLQIEDVNERIDTTCSKFSRGEISAKVARLIFDKLSSKEKVVFLDKIYAADVRKDNMRRLPPKILVPEKASIKNQHDIAAWGTVGKYYLINLYESSKTQNRFIRINKTIGQYEGSSFSSFSTIDIYPKGVIDSFAMWGFIDYLMFRGEEMDVSPLGLPSLMTLGAEIECVGANAADISNLESRLAKYGVDYLHKFIIKSDSTVRENDKVQHIGAEVVTGIMGDTVEDWTSLRNACLFLKAIGCEANRSCGGHIHIGTNTLGIDKMAWETFLKVWAEAEPLIYMISNRRGEKTRKGVELYAKPSYSSIRRVDWKSVKIRNEDDLGCVLDLINVNESFEYDRYKGLNLTNVGLQSKNTVEFRLSNGTVDYNIWRENMMLYGRMVQMAKMQSIDPTRKKEELEAFFEKEIPEKEKIKRFLNLVFDKNEEKEIFYRRWQYRAGEEPVFEFGAGKTYARQDWKERDKGETLLHQIASEIESKEKKQEIDQ